MSAAFQLVAGTALATTAVKLVGPVLLGGREMGQRFALVVALLSPALLAALVVTDIAADGQRLAFGARTVGVLAGGLTAWRTRSIVAVVAVAVAVAALLRAIGTAG
jgi:branched-subunit amino acid transport protein